AARKQTAAELRAKYVQELQVALTEKDVLQLQLQTAVKEFGAEKQALTAKLEEVQSAAAAVKQELEQNLAAKLDLETSLQRFGEQAAEVEQSRSAAQADAQQLAADKRELEDKLQQSEAQRLEGEAAVGRLRADVQHLTNQKQGYQTR